MRAEKREHKIQWSRGRRLAQQTQRAQLVLQRQAVARLHLERGHPTGQDLAVRASGLGEEHVVGGGAAGQHAGPDPAALLLDLGEIRALQLPHVLPVPAAGEQRVAVALHEAGEHRGSARVHADASSPSQGWRTAVEGGAVDAGHLTYTPEEEIREVGASDTIAVLLPIAEQIYLDEQRANARLFIEEQVPVAIATDYCSSIHATSLLLSIAAACSWYRMIPAEAIVGATLNAAYAVGRGRDRGSLDVGRRGDLVVIDCPHPDEIGLAWGAPLVRTVVSGGRVVWELAPTSCVTAG